MKTITFDTELRYEETVGTRKITLSALYFQNFLSGYLVRVELEQGTSLEHVHFYKIEALEDYTALIELAERDLI